MNILVYGNWRTGTNLLIDIFMNMGFFDFNEYYSLTGAGKLYALSADAWAVKESNDYLLTMLAPPRDRLSILKVNFPHVRFPSSEVLSKFDTKILIYRADFLQTVLSRIVAEDRLSWHNIGGVGQPPYSKSIDINTVSVGIMSLHRQTEKFMDNRHSLNINHVVNYESDLIPYIKLNGSRHYPSDNYSILNLEEIEDWYENSPLKKTSTTFKEHFDDLKIKTNTNTFTEFVETIKNKALNENK